MKLKEELSDKKCLLGKKEREKDELKNDINEQKQLFDEKKKIIKTPNRTTARDKFPEEKCSKSVYEGTGYFCPRNNDGSKHGDDSILGRCSYGRVK